MLFVLSISPLCTAAWVTFDGVGRLQPGLFRASHSIHFFGMLRVIFASSLDAFLASFLFLSLSQFTSSESSLFFSAFLRASDRVHFERPPARLCSCSWACACFVSKFHFVFRSMRWRASVDSGTRSCALAKERNKSRNKVVRSSPRPRCLGLC